MGSLSIIQSKLKTFKKHNPEASTWGFVEHSLRAFFRIASARWYLRGCQMGKLVSVNGKPVVDNRGEMIFGDEVRIWSTIIQAKLYTGKNGKLSVGKNSRLNGVHIDVRRLVSIGENVRIAPYTIIMDSDFHDVNDHFADGVSGPVVIEDDVWIATRSTILKGVTIGKGSVVATGSVVTRNVPPYTVVAGVPASVIRKLK